MAGTYIYKAEGNLATAALNNRVKIALSDIPFLCNFKKTEKPKILFYKRL